MKIGFFDSGIGGLSVMHEAFTRLPNEEFIFYADEEHVPYGEKTIAQIYEYVNKAVSFMLNKEAKAIVIACNTATSAAVAEIRRSCPVPVIGMEPAIKKALDLCPHQRVLAVATPVTVRGVKLQRLIEQVDHRHLVDLIALPELVRFAERGMFETDEVRELLKERFSSYDLNGYSSIVLGCTHFNYFKGVFRSILPDEMALIDGNEGTVSRLIDELGRIGGFENNDQSVEYYFSGKRVGDGGEIERIRGYLAQLDKVLGIT